MFQGINLPSKNSLQNPHSQEHGSIVVLVALALTALLGFCAIVTDIGLIYAQKAHLQISVDAAALAGVQELPSNPTLAAQTASYYANQNGSPSINVEFEDDDAKIIVRATQRVPTYFAQIWGITDEKISVTAKAMMVPPTELSGAVPLSVQEQNFVYGQKYVLKSGGGSGTSSWYLDDDKNNHVEKYGETLAASGWYGALELSGTGADTYESDLANGYQGTLRVGQIVNVKHGNMSGPTADGINTRLSRDTSVPHNTFTNYRRDASEIIYIPIVRIIEENENSVQEVQILGFAAFFLEGVAGNGNNSVVTGWFIKTLASNSQVTSSLTDLLNTEDAMENGGASTDFGLYTPKLVQN
ncbi:MAG: Tad domain-containing protein [Bacillota bacterium]|nr:Tad domain-containing protein [Bacillota bacterium]